MGNLVCFVVASAFEGVISGGLRGELERAGRWGRVIPHFEANEPIYNFFKKYSQKYDIVPLSPGTQVGTGT